MHRFKRLRQWSCLSHIQSSGRGERPAAQLPPHQAAAVAARNAANPQEASRATFLDIARRRAAHFAHF